MHDPRIEAAARAFNTAGWTCYGGGMEPGEYDNCLDCKKHCDILAAFAIEAADNAATFTTAEELDALPMGTVVVSPGYAHAIGGPVAFQKLYDGLWHRGGRASDTHPESFLPARAIYMGGGSDV